MAICVRCKRKPRKHYARLLVPINVVVEYVKYARRDFSAGNALCVRCWHSLDKLYGGKSEGMDMEWKGLGWIRADGQPVLGFDAKAATGGGQ